MTEDQQTVMNNEKRKYDRQLKAWAVDRAIELAKQNGRSQPEQVTEAAEAFCAWIYETDEAPKVPDAQEAADAVANAGHHGEVLQ